MKKEKMIFSFVLLLLFLFCSCNPKPGEEQSEAPKLLFGWRNAGLMPNLDSLSKWGTGFMDIAHSKDYIFVIDSRVADLKTLAPTAHRIFMSRQGSEKWEEIEIPSELKPLNMYGDDNGLYVGSYGNGQLWHYEPVSKKWTNLIAMQLIEKQKRNVYGIKKFNDRLLVSIAGYNDTMAIGLILHMQPDGTWKNIAPPDSSIEIYVAGYKTALYFTDAVELSGKLFVVSVESGIWTYDGTSWQRLPEYGEGDAPYVMELHKNRLYVGRYAYGGVQEIQDDYTRVQVDSNFATDGGYRKRTPIYVKTLISTGEHLIVAGDPGLPKVYMGDNGEPKGWRRLGYDSWCPPDQFRCIALTTYGLDVVGDTLYAEECLNFRYRIWIVR